MPSAESQAFSASWDTTAKMITAVVVVLLAVPAVAVGGLLTAAIGATILLAAYAWSPQSYAISDRTLIINRLIGNVRIPLDSIREARSATADDLRGCIRLFGSGGLFGWYGLFRTSKLGKSTWYVTDRNNAVVLIGEKKFVLSPDDVNGFLNFLAIPQNGPTDHVLDSLATYDSGNPIGWAIGVAAMLVAAASLFYSPGLPKYTLTRDALTIDDRFYPVTLSSSSVDVTHMRVVDLDVDKDWQPVRRTNGFGNLRYHSGWFQLAGGQKIRMYRAESKQLVLLPPMGDGSPVLIETPNPQAFVREVKQEWATSS